MIFASAIEVTVQSASISLSSGEPKGSIGMKAKSIPLPGKKTPSHCFDVSTASGKEKTTNYTALRDELARVEFKSICQT
jgi:hypothetical protein